MVLRAGEYGRASRKMQVVPAFHLSSLNATKMAPSYSQNGSDNHPQPLQQAGVIINSYLQGAGLGRVMLQAAPKGLQHWQAEIFQELRRPRACNTLSGRQYQPLIYVHLPAVFGKAIFDFLSTREEIKQIIYRWRLSTGCVSQPFLPSSEAHPPPLPKLPPFSASMA